jgi:hypothetical protein
MIRMLHDLAALASMAGFVSMVCVGLRFFG